MKYAIIYSSRTGNTKMLAETVQQELPQNDCVYFGPIDEKALEADRIYIGFWTDKGTCDQNTADFIKKLKKQEIFLFGTAGFGGSADYFDKIIHRTRELFPEGAKFLGSFMCQGKMPVVVRQRYEQMKKDGNPIPNIDRMIENFDIALSHPDKQDISNLRNWLRKM